MRLDELLTLADYEARKALAKKKVLLTFLLVLLSQLGGSLLFLRILELSRLGRLPLPVDPSLAWVFHYFLPIYLISALAVLVGAGLVSEEFEKGSHEVLYTKALGRLGVGIGKLLGGYFIILLALALNALLAASLPHLLYGPQHRLELMGWVLAGSLLAVLPFYSLAFLFSSATRSTLLSSTTPISLLVVLPLIQGLLIFLERSTGQELGWAIRALPTWPINLPAFLLPREVLLRGLVTSPLALLFEGEPFTATLMLVGYSLAFTSSGLLFLLKRDM